MRRLRRRQQQQPRTPSSSPSSTCNDRDDNADIVMPMTMPSCTHVLTLLHTQDDDDALAHPRACPPPYTMTMTTTPSTTLPSLPCEGTEAIVQRTPLCMLCLCFCSPHLCPPSLLMPMCIPTVDNNNNNNASSSSSSLPSLRAQQHDNMTTTTLLPSHDNVVIVVTSVLVCPHPRAPDNTT